MTLYDAIVVGGGPGGASAALLLARAGWSVALVERAPFPRAKVCGEYISAATLALMHELDMVPAGFDGAGPEVRRVGLFAGEVTCAAEMPPHVDRLAHYGRAFARDTLDGGLLQLARDAGVVVWQPARAIGMRRERGAYACDIEHHRRYATLHARHVIAAHGAWETGRLPTQPHRTPAHAGDLFGFKAHFAHGCLPGDLMPLVAFRGGYGGMVHTSGGRMSFSCCVRRDALAASREDFPGMCAGEALLHYIRRENRGLRLAMDGACRVGPWLSVGPVRPGIRLPAPAGMYAIGNAAGEAHPVVAEGISMAIQSAVLLARLLLERGRDDPDAVAADYERRWRGLFAPRVRLSAVYAGLAMRPALSTPVAQLLARLPALLTTGARWSGKARSFA